MGLFDDMKPTRERGGSGAADRERFADAASAALGVPRDVIAAHAMLETGREGKTVGAYNYGNIKAGKAWQGETAALNALEYGNDGKAYNEPSRFRAYASPEDAAADYADLIRRRYPQAAQATSAEEFARGLQAGGYATDPRYIEKLTGVARRAGTERGRATNTGSAETMGARGGLFADMQPAKQGRTGMQTAGDVLAGAVRGAGSIGATILQPVDWLARKAGIENDYIGRTDRREAMDAALRDQFGADVKSGAYQAGKIGAEIAGTIGMGGALAQSARAALPAAAAARAAPALTAIETGGMSSGGLRGIGGLATRAAGGATVGAMASGVMGGSEDDTAQAAALGAFLPVGIGAAGTAVRAATGAIAPFTASGQSRIVGDILRTYAHDPDAAAAALARYRDVVPGSRAITSAAAGDVGLSGLTRTMQANPQMANELAVRATAQNAARNAAIEGVAGNQGTISAAKEARNAATGALREGVLERAGQMDGRAILSQLDDLIRDPNNAGSTARQALERVRSQVAQSTDDAGAINARALYEIRKDIGLAMQGKLQGEAGNLRYAKGVLDRVQSAFDDAIGASARRAGGSAPNLPVPYGTVTDDPWRQYLATYAAQSKPINQMERLQEVLTRVRTGATDMGGDQIISAAKLTQLLSKDGGELQRLLTPEQMQVLRNVAADAQAGRLGLEAGKAVGSNTVQNLSQTWLLNRVLGQYGESPLVSSVMKKPLGLLYGGANEQITDQLARALLDPEIAAEMMKRAAKRPPKAPGPASVAGLIGSDAGNANAATTGPRRGLLD